MRCPQAAKVAATTGGRCSSTSSAQDGARPAWQLIAHEETKANEGADLWDGRALVLPAHIHGRSPEKSGPLPERFNATGMRVVSSEDGFGLDIQLGERSGRDRVLNDEPTRSRLHLWLPHAPEDQLLAPATCGV